MAQSYGQVGEGKVYLAPLRDSHAIVAFGTLVAIQFLFFYDASHKDSWLSGQVASLGAPLAGPATIA